MAVETRYSICGQSGTVEELDLIKETVEEFWAICRPELAEVWVDPCIENFAPTCMGCAE